MTTTFLPLISMQTSSFVWIRWPGSSSRCALCILTGRLTMHVIAALRDDVGQACKGELCC